MRIREPGAPGDLPACGSEESIRRLVNALPMAVYQYTLEEGHRPRILYISDAIEALAGVSAQAVMADAQILFAGIDPRDLEDFVVADLRAHRARSHFYHEVRFVHPNGQVRWAAVKSSPCTEKEGCLTYQGYIEDITERKTADERVRSSESLLQQIFDTTNVAIFLLDAQGIIVRANRMMAEMFACSVHDLEDSVYVNLIAPAEREAAQRNMDALLTADIDSVHLERPFQRRDGTVFWGSVTSRRFRADEKTEYGLLVVIMDVSERKRAEDEARSLAFYDPLTNLANRRLLLKYLRAALAASEHSGLYGALIFIDLDRFKTLNDTLGHDVGDQLLVSVARRLQSTVRAGDTVARLGGDEFVVVLDNLNAQASVAAKKANAVALKILRQLALPYAVQRHTVRSTPSLGVTLFRGREPDIDELLKHADMAMYEAKAAGRNTVRFFDPQMQERITARAQIERDLYGAIESGQFILHLQPQMDVHGQCAGAEALVRWQHPANGIIFPGQFISVAEDTGQIREIGHAVLLQAMRMQRRWQENEGARAVVIAVNISARQFHSRSFVQEIEFLLASTGADPHRLQLELTESMFLGDIDDAISRMQSLRALGIGFALDDFGTGYSSLAYLKRLPLSRIKIDRSFVRDILTDSNDLAICRSIIVLARSLGLQAVAEGVETRAQWQQLRADGCEAAQGYLFARPMTESAFLDWLAGARPDP